LHLSGERRQQMLEEDASRSIRRMNDEKSIAVTENELGLAERTTAMLKRKQEKGKRPRAAKYCTSGCSARNETSQLPQTNEYTDEYAILMGQSEKK
jgi:hypothetical protein